MEFSVKRSRREEKKFDKANFCGVKFYWEENSLKVPSKGLPKMGNIHTVGPNEALIVSGKSRLEFSSYEWRNNLIWETAHTCKLAATIYCHEEKKCSKC